MKDVLSPFCFSTIFPNQVKRHPLPVHYVEFLPALSRRVLATLVWAQKDLRLKTTENHDWHGTSDPEVVRFF